MNRALDQVTEDGEVVLLTSHLLYPDVITRLSGYSRKAMYVLHDHQDIVPHSRSLPYRIFIRWLYGNQKITCVGTEIKREMREVYHLPQKTIQPMWNPLNFQEIDRKKEEALDFPGPYMLYCARLTAVKNHGSKQILRGELKEYLCEPTAADVAAKMRKALVSYPGNLKKYTSECAVEKVVEKYMETYRKWNS